MQRRTLIALVISFALLVAGLALNQARQVFVNATLLCLSCIGIQ